MKLTVQVCQAVRADLNVALKEVSEKYGIDFVIGNIKFTADSMKTSIEGVVRTEQTLVNALLNIKNTPEMVKLIKHLGSYGITPNDLSKSWNFRSLQGCKLVGYVPRRYKFPYTVQDASGRMFKITRSQVEDSLNIKIA